MKKVVSENDTVLLFFTRSADEEARVKRLIDGGSFSDNRTLARKMISETDKLLRKTGYPVRIISSDQQRGDTFGERFGNAFQQLFDEGFKRVLSVGNDCLQIDTGLLKKALLSLEVKEMVVGPAADGGAYMIGMQQHIFDERSFKRLRWRTRYLLDDLVGYCKNQKGTVKLFEQLHDIDHPSDLSRSLQFIAFHLQNFKLAGILRSILYGGIQNGCLTLFRPVYSFHLTTAFSHRAPPRMS